MSCLIGYWVPRGFSRFYNFYRVVADHLIWHNFIKNSLMDTKAVSFNTKSDLITLKHLKTFLTASLSSIPRCRRYLMPIRSIKGFSSCSITPRSDAVADDQLHISNQTISKPEPPKCPPSAPPPSPPSKYNPPELPNKYPPGDPSKHPPSPPPYPSRCPPRRRPIC